MELGFETIGNATLICHDHTPVLVTDPWTTGGAFFGSWGLSHAIPEEQLSAIHESKYVWISHGHPDHFSPASLESLRDKQILLSDHVGGLIREGLTARGFKVSVLKDAVWVPLSQRIRVLSIADYYQDSLLLVDVDGKLIVNLNDTMDHGWGGFVKRIIREYKTSFMLHLSGFGDTDMINLYREDGAFITPRAAKKHPVGRSMANWARQWGTRYTVPFSSMHIYQRADSVWADRYTTRLADYPVGWDAKEAELLPAFIRYDLQRDCMSELKPAANLRGPIASEEFGDNWSEPMEAQDRSTITKYFKSFAHLGDFLDFIRVRMGGTEHLVEFRSEHFKRGLTFDTPRGSFMTAVKNEVFDDLLNGNYMKVTLHGKFGATPLYPDFTLYVTKFGDNGQAKSADELDRYFASYRKRFPLGYWRHRVEQRLITAIRNAVTEDGPLFRAGARTYHWLKRTR